VDGRYSWGALKDSGREVAHDRHHNRPRPRQRTFTDAERLALAGFLAGYRGLTREASTTQNR